MTTGVNNNAPRRLLLQPMSSLKRLPTPTVILLVALLWQVSSGVPRERTIESGCLDGSTEGLQDRRHPGLAACDGHWSGHVGNASTSLCASGWTVCGWDSVDLLRTVAWRDAMALTGCYALNAAQFHDGQCRPCTGGPRQGNLAGVGSGCAYRSYGLDSCITGGQMDVVDTVASLATVDQQRPCSYRPGLVTGVLCCRQPGEPPEMIVLPAAVTHVQVGGLFVLSCQAVGNPEPRITWLRDGRHQAVDSKRIASFDSGYLIVSMAELSDSAMYTCVASNSHGNATALARVVVTEHPSGCADGTTDGLYDYEEVQACRGRWRGHVRRAKSLCAPGWQVCSPRHSIYLKMLTWTDVTQLEGCYAYNAANSLNLCSVCRQGDMAGVGRDCGRLRPGSRSCLADGQIDVHPTRWTGSSSSSGGGGSAARQCDYASGRTSGVLCCRRPEKWQIGYHWSAPRCKPNCENGGVCVADGQCKCPTGYKGAFCQNPICPGGCIPNSMCVRPATCRCLDGFSGPKCRYRDHPTSPAPTPVGGSGRPSSRDRRPATSATKPAAALMSTVRPQHQLQLLLTGESVSSGTNVDLLSSSCRCLNGGRCVGGGVCRCPPGFRGKRCRHVVGRQRSLANSKEPPAEINRTEQ